MHRQAFHPRSCEICGQELDAAARVRFVQLVNILRRAKYSDHRAILIACQSMHTEPTDYTDN